ITKLLTATQESVLIPLNQFGTALPTNDTSNSTIQLECLFYSNYDIPGNDIGSSVPNVTLDECCQQCLDMDNYCKAFAWGPQDNEPTCFLKYAYGTNVVSSTIRTMGILTSVTETTISPS
ncbi:unnamed protein product, partial [Didymodactylos carnosus]